MRRWRSRGLFSGGTFIQSLFGQYCREVINVQAVAHARSRVLWQRRDRSVAIVIAGRGIVQDSEMCDLSAFGCELDNLVAVLCFSAVSIVHGFLSLFIRLNSGRKLLAHSF